MNFKKYIAIGIATIAIILVSGVGIVKANPSYFNRFQLGGQGTATTSMSYLVPTIPAFATSTLSINSSSNYNSAQDSAKILVQFTASTTMSILAIQPEFSQDGIDWYAIASTTYGTVAPAPFLDGRATLQFASSTAVQYGSGTLSRVMRMYDIPTPTKYARVLFYLLPGSSNGAVWSEVVTKQQTP